MIGYYPDFVGIVFFILFIIMVYTTLNAEGQEVARSLGSPFDKFIIETVKEKFIDYRATYIRRDVEKNGMSREFLQPIRVEMQALSQTDNYYDCEIKTIKSKKRIPKPLRLKGDTFYYVGSPDGKKSYTETHLDIISYTTGNKFNQVRYAFLDEYLYVFFVDFNQAQRVLINTPFVYPSEAYNFNKTDLDEPYTDDDTFPIAEDMLTSIRVEIKKEMGLQHPVKDEQIRINDN